MRGRVNDSFSERGRRGVARARVKPERRGGRRLAALIAGLLLAGAAVRGWLWRPSAADTPEAWRRIWAQRGLPRPNLLLVTLDTTRADHLGCYGAAQARTPNLDGLARSGVLFAQAQAVAPLTLPA